MSRLAIVFILLIFAANFSYSQYFDFPFIGWSQTTEIKKGDYAGNFTSSIVETKIIRDTMINGTKYFELVNKYGSSFLRKEDGKIFKLNPDFSSEKLIMNFSLSIGDRFIYEYYTIPGGLKVDTLYVLSNDKILGPGQDSIYKMILTKNPTIPFGGITWIEGVGDHISGLISGIPPNEMTFAYHLCTINDKNQTIYSTEFFDCGCDKLFGVDNDRDGSRNKTGSEIIITINKQNFGLDQILSINKCDTLYASDEAHIFRLIASA